MTFTKIQQDKYRDKFVDDSLDKAWHTLAQCAYIRLKQLPKIQASVDECSARIEVIEQEVKAIETSPEYHTVENRTKVNTLKAEANHLELLRNGDERPLGNGLVNRGLVGEIIDLNGIALKHEIQADRYMQLADFAEDWEWVPTPLDPAEDKTGTGGGVA